MYIKIVALNTGFLTRNCDKGKYSVQKLSFMSIDILSILLLNLNLNCRIEWLINIYHEIATLVLVLLDLS